MVVQMSEEGSYLYLKRQSEDILMSAKCWFSSKRVNLYEGGALLGFWHGSITWIDEVEDVGHRRVREEAKGGAPLM
jgi:hypothetical protein